MAAAPKGEVNGKYRGIGASEGFLPFLRFFDGPLLCCFVAIALVR